MTAHQMLAKVRNLPLVSKAALEVTRLLGSSGIANEEVVRLLRQDNVLTAKLLRACNSPALGLREPVSSLDQAVLMLGHARVFQMATAIAFGGPLSVKLSPFEMQTDDLWLHSLRTATAAEAIAERADLNVEPSTAFTVGLLHDIGKLVTSEFLTREAMISIREHIKEGHPAIAAERAVLGTDHAEVGGSLLYLWHLPDQLVEGVALHHRVINSEQHSLAAVTALANVVAHRAAAFQLNPERTPRLGETQLAGLGLSPEVLESVFARVCGPCSASTELVALSA